MTGHTMDQCYKLHGYPSGHKFFGKTKAAGSFVNQATGDLLHDSEEESNGLVSLTKGQYKEFMALLKAKDQSTTPHSTNNTQTLSNHLPTMSGISMCLSAIHSSHTSHEIPWIIDSGATDHTVCNTSFFSHITSTPSYYVRLPNGEVVSVTHIGVVQLNNSISLQHVLCAPSFTFNLLSTRKLSEQSIVV